MTATATTAQGMTDHNREPAITEVINNLIKKVRKLCKKTRAVERQKDGRSANGVPSCNSNTQCVRNTNTEDADSNRGPTMEDTASGVTLYTDLNTTSDTIQKRSSNYRRKAGRKSREALHTKRKLECQSERQMKQKEKMEAKLARKAKRAEITRNSEDGAGAPHCITHSILVSSAKPSDAVPRSEKGGREHPIGTPMFALNRMFRSFRKFESEAMFPSRRRIVIKQDERPASLVMTPLRTQDLPTTAPNYR